MGGSYTKSGNDVFPIEDGDLFRRSEYGCMRVRCLIIHHFTREAAMHDASSNPLAIYRFYRYEPMGKQNHMAHRDYNPYIPTI